MLMDMVVQGKSFLLPLNFVVVKMATDDHGSYQNSIGVAEDVVGLVHDMLAAGPKSHL